MPPALQEVPLIPDTAYFLDNALDQWDIDAFTHAVIDLYGNRSKVAEIVDRPRQGRGFMLGKGSACRELCEYAHDLATELPEDDRRAFVASTLIREPPHLESLAECLAQWHIGDATTGGYLEPYRQDVHTRINRDGTPSKKLMRRLTSPAACRRYVKLKAHDTDSIPHCRVHADLIRSRQPWPAHPDEALRLEDFFLRAHARRQEHDDRLRERWMEELRAGARPRPRVTLKRPDRKALRRGVEHAIDFLGEADTKKFLAGPGKGGVEITGRHFLFYVALGSRLLSTGHRGGLQIVVKDRLSTLPLCGLCLFWEDTPAIDQLVALALHVRAGEEQSLLDVGNPYNVTPAGAQHPLIAERLKNHSDILHGRLQAGELIEELRQQVDIRAAVRRRPREQFSHRDLELLIQSDYVERYRSLYLWPVTEAIWGQDAKHVCRFTMIVDDPGQFSRLQRRF